VAAATASDQNSCEAPEMYQLTGGVGTKLMGLEWTVYNLQSVKTNLYGTICHK